MMEIDPVRRKIVDLVEQASAGRICLLDFQRDFVWKREQVADLVRALLRRYFIGALLLLHCDPKKPPFAPTTLRGAESGASPRPEHLVLDGQQQLLALLYALVAPNLPLKDSPKRRWFFVDLNLLLEEPDNDEIVFDRTERELDGLDRIEKRYQLRAMPCAALFSLDRSIKWLRGLRKWLRKSHSAESEAFEEELKDRLIAILTDFDNYQAPVVELPLVDEADPDAIGRVCAIFEKLNSTGIELSVYDLLTARLHPSGVKLHELRDEVCDKHTRLAAWSEDKADTNKFGVFLLRTLALLRGLDPKPRILINLEPTGFDKDWRRAAAAMGRALELVTLVGQDGFGVFDPKWLPGFGLLPALAALRAEIEDRRLGDRPRADLRRWYWCKVFLERYSSAVESKSRKDYAELLAYWTDGEAEPAVFAEAKARIGSSEFSIRDSASHASAVYNGVFCLLALGGARDWKFGESVQLQALQDHHIFPQAYLKPHRVDKQVDINSVVNRTLISSGLNGIIKDKSLAGYVVDPSVFPSRPSLDLLRPHFVDDEALAVMWTAEESLSPEKAAAEYERFRTAREQAIVAEIRRVCGVI